MEKILPGKITISRTQGGSREDKPIRIEIQDGSSRTRFLEVYMSLEAFASAVTGLGYQDVEFTLYKNAPVGKVHEYKTEKVFFPSFYHREPSKEALDATQIFEVDGWRGETSDLCNHHRWIKGPNGEHGALVNFHRYTEPKE